MSEKKGIYGMKIMLCCAAGMSTSLLVTKMEKAAQERGIEVEILANPVSEAEEQLDVDAILLSPQIRYAEKATKKLVEDKIPVINIDLRSYGRMDGAKVLDDALKAIEEFKN